MTVDCGNGLDCSQGLTFYIYLPPNSYPEMTFTINTTDGSYATKHFEDEDDPIVIERNVYYPTTFNSLTFFDYATLVAGSTFRSAIPSDATSVVFEYRSSVTTGTLLSTSDSPLPIYGNLDGTVWRVSTIAAQIEATNCSTMFAGKTSLTNISFGGGFSTSIVTNMGQMFYGCTSLSGLDLSMFNTSNVTNMGNMFAGCIRLNNLNIANFDLGGLTTNDAKSGMFRRVGSMNSSLNITCTWSAKNELLRNRDIYALPNYATFNGGGGGEHQ